MEILASKFLNLPIAALEENRKVGNVSRILVYPDDASWLGVELKHLPLTPARILSATDIRSVDKEVILIESAEVLTEPAEILRVKEIIEHNFDLFGLPVVCRDGESLGKIIDFQIDTTAGQVTAFRISGVLKKDRIVNFKQVYELNWRRLIIDSTSKREQTAGAATEMAIG